MPRERPITLEGLLLLDGRQLILQMPDGGQWRLLARGQHDRLFGRRVRVDGARQGHDVVAVERITPA
ncbi:DUF5818 domain-containing protein [uncultured Sphingobium sp.]|uniref:DUF5818 domain-containing protein n=1 Tax=uncultured Sphingobium sp. TaxID=316087 RepID=UPI0026290CB6|nr:DUF5818 domain-containing protein [uncultured Sphingobium sp.]